MRVEYMVIVANLVLAFCVSCRDESENAEEQVDNVQMGDASAPPSYLFWDCDCGYKCGLTLSISEDRTACQRTDVEAKQEAEEVCNAKRNDSDNCEICTCECTTNNAPCRSENSYYENTGYSGAAGAPVTSPSLYCCALGKLCSQSAIGTNPCQTDPAVSGAAAAGDEQACKAALDNAVLDVQVTDCAVDPNCNYTEADALAECQ